MGVACHYKVQRRKSQIVRANFGSPILVMDRSRRTGVSSQKEAQKAALARMKAIKEGKAKASDLFEVRALPASRELRGCATVHERFEQSCAGVPWLPDIPAVPSFHALPAGCTTAGT